MPELTDASHIATYSGANASVLDFELDLTLRNHLVSLVMVFCLPKMPMIGLYQHKWQWCDKITAYLCESLEGYERAYQ